MKIEINPGEFFESIDQLHSIFDQEKLKNGDTDIFAIVSYGELTYSVHFTCDPEEPDVPPFRITFVENHEEDEGEEISLMRTIKNFQTFDEMLKFEMDDGKKLKALLTQKVIRFIYWDLF